jgi:hypothetical protein
MSAEENLGTELPEELKTIETALRQLTPIAGQIDRDRLMYLAGQASVTGMSSHERSAGFAWQKAFADWKLWPIATAALMLISVTLSGLLLATRSRSSVVYVKLPQASNEKLPYAAYVDEGVGNLAAQHLHNASSYLQLRNFVLTHGNGALPPTPAANNLKNSPPQPSLPTLQRQWFGDES